MHVCSTVTIQLYSNTAIQYVEILFYIQYVFTYVLTLEDITIEG